MHFFRLRNAHPNPELTLNGTLVPVVEQTKFLGVIFHNKAHIPSTHSLPQRKVAHTSWGADQHTLLHLYRSLVRSELDYGSVVYGSTRDTMPRCLQNLTCLKYVCSSQ